MPPKKNKKPSRNGFWQFVMECKDKVPSKSIEEAKATATKKWASMTKEEKKPYEQMAILQRDSFRSVKLTTDGYEIEEIERQQKEAENKVKLMKNNIVRMFRTATIAGNLEEEVFILIHINHLTYVPAQDKYFICEVAMASVSLQDGIKEIFHRIVKPGKLPLGFYGPALAHSKETHQLIDIVQDEDYDNDTQDVFFDMIAFMRKYSGDKPITVYVDEKTFEMTTKVINNFQEEFQVDDEIKIYNMQFMFFALKNAAAGRNVWPTETFSYNEIEKDVYCYCANISCEFHEIADNCIYCSKSIVTRYAYTICDNCCGELSIRLIPGSHVPANVKVTNNAAKCILTSTSMSSIDKISAKGRVSPVSSRGYEENYPPLGSTRSSASSIVSFSSMKTPQPKHTPLTTSNVAALEESFQSTSIAPPRRNHKNLKFPQHGYKSNPSQ